MILDETTTLLGSSSLFSWDEAARLNCAALRAGTIIVAIIPVLMLHPQQIAGGS